MAPPERRSDPAPAAPAAQARRAVAVYAAARPLWQPGGTAPAHLDGSLPGDFGFDPLNLGANPAALDWYRNAELQNGRWAMLGVAGVLVPGLLTKAGVLSVPEWYQQDVIQNGQAIPFNSLLMVMFFMFNIVELKRWQDMRKPGSQAEAGSFLGFETQFKGTGVSGYPGGVFDPLNLAGGSAASVADLKLKEIKNARVAMLAFLGFQCQYTATGKGPLDNLADHIAAPWAANFCTNGVSVPINIF